MAIFPALQKLTHMDPLQPLVDMDPLHRQLLANMAPRWPLLNTTTWQWSSSKSFSCKLSENLCSLCPFKSSKTLCTWPIQQSLWARIEQNMHFCGNLCFCTEQGCKMGWYLTLSSDHRQFWSGTIAHNNARHCCTCFAWTEPNNQAWTGLM